MSRTPLMHWLGGLARRHADRPRTPVPLPPRAMSRRQFIAAAAGFGVAACATSRLAPTTTPIAIVGGGIAGLTAARTLTRAGVPAVVYEASTRIGGRMHSDDSGYWNDGQRTEWCGELIDGNHDTLLGLAREAELSLTDLQAAQPAGAEPTQFVAGERYTRERADADFRIARAALARDFGGVGASTTFAEHTPAAVRLDRMSVREWIESRIAGGARSAFGALLDVAFASDYGAETEDLSALNLAYLIDVERFGAPSQRQYRLADGNGQLPLRMAERLPRGSIVLGWRLEAIGHRSDGRVLLTFATPGGTRRASTDHAILALPFAVLRTLDIGAAGFDTLKQQTIRQLGRARNAKLHLQFARRFWNAASPVSTGSSLADLGYQSTYDVSRGQRGASGVLVNYRGGATADRVSTSPYSHGTDDPALAREARWLLAQLDRVWPGAANEWNGRVSLSAPARDPNLGCSYSYWRVGQFTTLRGYERMRQGNVHFAGEHCSVAFQGYMEGGAAEGVRAANEVLRDLGSSMPGNARIAS